MCSWAFGWPGKGPHRLPVDCLVADRVPTPDTPSGSDVHRCWQCAGGQAWQPAKHCLRWSHWATPGFRMPLPARSPGPCAYRTFSIITRAVIKDPILRLQRVPAPLGRCGGGALQLGAHAQAPEAPRRRRHGEPAAQCSTCIASVTGFHHHALLQPKIGAVPHATCVLRLNGGGGTCLRVWAGSLVLQSCCGMQLLQTAFLLLAGNAGVRDIIPWLNPH